MKIQAVIFDLDGTLIQTEVLKARSYASAVNELTAGRVDTTAVLEIFDRFVGLSRQEVVAGLTEHFSEALSAHLQITEPARLGAALIEKRLTLYRAILDDVEQLSRYFCTYTLGLFHRLHRDGFTLVLATMSHLPEVRKVTESMGIHDQFHRVFTRDDVDQGKPDPEIYDRARSELGLDPGECLVIEDSVNGILAAQRAGMPVFAVTNAVTRRSVHECGLLRPEAIVDDLTLLEEQVYGFLESRG